MRRGGGDAVHHGRGKPDADGDIRRQVGDQVARGRDHRVGGGGLRGIHAHPLADELPRAGVHQGGLHPAAADIDADRLHQVAAGTCGVLSMSSRSGGSRRAAPAGPMLPRQ